MKTCTACHNDLPETEFYAYGGNRKNKLRPDCKSCHKAQTGPADRLRYQQKKHLYRERNRLARAAARALLDGLKDRPCKDCLGKFKPWQMQFDHLGDKLYTVSAMASSFTASSILKEVAKCEIVCANCHADRTHQRRARSSSARAPGVMTLEAARAALAGLAPC
jgi:hypothetical protein